MSRIILEKHPGGDEDKFVVGWDRTCASYFWQEFAKEPEVTHDEDKYDWYVVKFDGTKTIWNSKQEAEEHKWDDWEEMVAFAGYIPSELATMEMFMRSLPENIKPLVTEPVQELLKEHSTHPDPGRLVVDLTKSNVVMATSYKVEVKTYGETKWASNALRFATKDEAKKAAVDLARRWTMLEEWRVAPSSDPVNYKWEDERAVKV